MTAFGFVGGSHFSGPEQAAELTAAGADLIFDDMARLPEILLLKDPGPREARGG